MPVGRLNCEVFQIRTGVYRKSVERGLAVTALDGKRYLDPQIEPGYNTSLGTAGAESLKLQFSQVKPPIVEERVVRSFSINPAALDDIENIHNYRIYEPIAKDVGKLALVSVVDHDSRGVLSLYGQNKNLNFLNFYRVGESLYDPFVSVVFLQEGEVVTVSHDTGGDFNSDMRDSRYAYHSDNEEGLVFVPEARPGAPDSPPADGSGVREPRNPLPSGLTSSIAIDAQH